MLRYVSPSLPPSSLTNSPCAFSFASRYAKHLFITSHFDPLYPALYLSNAHANHPYLNPASLPSAWKAFDVYSEGRVGKGILGGAVEMGKRWIWGRGWGWEGWGWTDHMQVPT